MILEKSSFVEINKRNSKRIILFGSGNIAEKTIQKVGVSNIECIVDNSADLQGTEYQGLQIKSPVVITEKHFIIICTTAISEITLQLLDLNLKPNKDFIISPVLNDLLS